MNDELRVSAPGKLFLVGEYAVLEGAPALLAAVNRRAVVTLRPSENHVWSMSAPSIGVSTVTLDDHGVLPAALDDSTRAKLHLFDAVRSTVSDALDTPLRPMEITIDSSSFSLDGYKLGLGSSASVAAALTAALAHAGGLELDAASEFGLAFAAHRAAQSGTGSGGDVAASVYGGIISYERGITPRSISWPDSLVVYVVATGNGASTTELVGSVQRYANSHPSDYAEQRDILTALASRAATALSEPEEFLRLTDDYYNALRSLDERADVGIVTDFHAQLHELAASHGAVFKTSGAGGGDVGLVFARSDEQPEPLLSSLRDTGAVVVPLRLGVSGLNFETAP